MILIYSVISRVRLHGYPCNDPPRLLRYMCLGFNVTIDAFWHILIRLGFWASSFLFPILSSCPGYGPDYLNLAPEKPLLVFRDKFSSFSDRVGCWALIG